MDAAGTVYAQVTFRLSAVQRKVFGCRVSLWIVDHLERSGWPLSLLSYYLDPKEFCIRNLGKHAYSKMDGSVSVHSIADPVLVQRLLVLCRSHDLYALHTILSCSLRENLLVAENLAGIV